MRLLPPRSSRTDPLCPYTTLFRPLDTIGNLERGGILHCSPDAVQDWAGPRPKHGRVVCGSPAGEEESRGRGHRRGHGPVPGHRSEEHTSELQSLMRSSYAVFSLKKKTT